MYHGEIVCRSFFLFVNNCGIRRYRNLLKQVKTNCLAPKMHGNVSNANRAFSHDIVDNFKAFLTTFTDVHGLVLPGRTPLFRHITDVKLLPIALLRYCSFTQHFIYEKYLEGCGLDNPMRFPSSLKYWKDLYPNSIIQKPRTDLCAECHHNTTNLQKLHSLSESARLALLQKSQEHLNKVMAERINYREASRRLQTPLELGPRPCLSYKGKMHYAFDFAQQVFLPHDPQQVGPLYFLTPYKVSLFGVACEPAGKFVLYLIPESAAAAGNGSNTVFHCFIIFSRI